MEEWPQQACTTMFFSIPKHVTSERPIARMPTLIRWWEALRTPEVAKWQMKYRVDWDATDGRNGGAQQTAWEIVMELEGFYGKANQKRVKERWFSTWRKPSSVSASLWSGLGRRTSVSQERSCECCAFMSGTRGGYSLKDVRRSRYGPSRPSCQGRSGVACSYVLCCRMR